MNSGPIRQHAAMALGKNPAVKKAVKELAPIPNGAKKVPNHEKGAAAYEPGSHGKMSRAKSHPANTSK